MIPSNDRPAECGKYHWPLYVEELARPLSMYSLEIPTVDRRKRILVKTCQNCGWMVMVEE